MQLRRVRVERAADRREQRSGPQDRARGAPRYAAGAGLCPHVGGSWRVACPILRRVALVRRATLAQSAGPRERAATLCL